MCFGGSIKEDFIPEILAVDEAVYPPYMRGTYESVRPRYLKNPDSFVVVRDSGRVVGYLCFFPISKALRCGITSSERMYDDDISPSDIRPYGAENDLFIISAAILPGWQDGEAIHLLVEGFRRFLREKAAAGRNIRSLTAAAVSPDGLKFAGRLGFRIVKELEGGYRLMECDREGVRAFACGEE